MTATLRNARGNALLVTMIALAVLLVLSVGAIRFTGTNREAAAAKTRGDQVSACASTARKYLLSRMRVFGSQPTQLKLVSEKLLDDAVTTKQSTLDTAHYGQVETTGPGNAKSIAVVEASAFAAASRQVRDLANTSPTSGTLGGQYYRVVVKCAEPGNAGNTRESEVEFLFRYGI
jgi:hypothetical protein